MPLDPLLDTQLAHNAWATRRLLEACRALSPEQWSRGFDIGPGPLSVTLPHIVEAMLFFADNFAGREYHEPAGFAQRTATPDGVIAVLDQADRALRASIESFLARQSLSASLLWSTAAGGRLPATVALAQAIAHGTHHRVQCLHMLKRLGVWPLPDIDAIDFVPGAQSG